MANGPPMEVDCSRPQNVVTRLLPGQQFTLTWSGIEQVGNRRICDEAPGYFSYVNNVTLSGDYTFKLCYALDLEDGKANSSDPNKFVGAKVKGQSKCEEKKFHYPAAGLVEIHIQ